MSALGAALGASFLCPTASQVSGVSVEVLNTGWVDADWRQVDPTVEPGPVRLPFLVGKINHPQGTVLVDAGLGLQTRSGHYPRFPHDPSSVDVPAGLAIIEQLDEAPDIILLTHLHYDHVSGLLDLGPQVEAWTTLEEWRTARTSNLAFPARRMEAAVTWRPVDLTRGNSAQTLGVPGIDVYGDGTIWYLSTPGHTPGAASVLVRAEEQAWLFIGDTAWVDSHLEKGRRPRVVSMLVDGRPRALQDSLNWARYIKKKCPTLQIVSGHEPKWVLQ